MDELLSNPYWHALCTEQADIAIGGEFARRYPHDVIPFGGIAAPEEQAFTALHTLLAPGESMLIISEVPVEHAGIRQIKKMPGVQMLCSPEAQAAKYEDSRVSELGAADVPEMIALKAVAFPGYFGPRAASLGRFYGIRVMNEIRRGNEGVVEGHPKREYPQGELVAMAGERMALPGLREISAVCTHPRHLGKGYAAALIRRLMQEHAGRGLRSFLQAEAGNSRAIALYERLGFAHLRTLAFQQIERVG